MDLDLDLEEGFTNGEGFTALFERPVCPDSLATRLFALEAEFVLDLEIEVDFRGTDLVTAGREGGACPPIEGNI